MPGFDESVVAEALSVPATPGPFTIHAQAMAEKPDGVLAHLRRDLEELTCLAAEARAGAQDDDVTAAVLYELEAADVERRIAKLESEQVMA